MIDGKLVLATVALRIGPKGVFGNDVLRIGSELLTVHRVNEFVRVGIGQRCERRGAIERM